MSTPPSSIQNGGPAFPIALPAGANATGLTVRDAAALVVLGALYYNNPAVVPATAATTAYTAADAYLKERAK